MSAYYKSRIVYPNRRQERRKRAFGFVFFMFVLFALAGFAGLGFYWFAQLETFRIQHIAVEGTRALSQDEIRVSVERALDGALFFVIPKNHFAFFSSRQLAEMLRKEFPRIQAASVKKSFPDGIRISVEERTEWGVLCDGAKVAKVAKETNVATNTPLSADASEWGRRCGYIDRDGTLFEYPLEISGVFLPVISDDSLAEMRRGETAVSRDTISFFENVNDAARSELGVSFIELEILKELPDDYRLRAHEGWFVWVPRSGAPALWLNPLKVLLERELKNRAGLEYIDARFGNKMFYKRK